MSDDEERLPPWQWPARWAGDETFWRNVTAGVLIALVGFGAKMAYDHVPWRFVWRLYANGTLILPTIVAVLAIASGCLVAHDRVTRKRLIQQGKEVQAKIEALGREIDALPDDSRS
jgi:hypothetical protein